MQTLCLRNSPEYQSGTEGFETEIHSAEAFADCDHGDTETVSLEHTSEVPCEDTLAAYLHDIKYLVPLPREQEQALAKAYHEAESLKRFYANEWLFLFSALIDWRTILKKRLDSAVLPDAALQDLTGMLKTIRSRTVTKNHRHACTVKSVAPDCAKDLNLRKLYRTGTVAKLKRFLKPIPNEQKHRLIRILRQFLVHEKQAKQAKEALAQSNLRFVISIAKHYVNRGLSLADLIQEGNLGLIRAIEKFDYRRNLRLSTYAGWWIRQTIVRALENKAHPIRVPVYMNSKVRKIKSLMKQDVTLPETDVVADVCKNDALVYRAVQVMYEPIALDAAVNNARSLHECIAEFHAPFIPDREIERSHWAQGTARMLQCLSPREKKIISLHFGLEDNQCYTLEEIGARYGISRERVRQIEKAALRKLRLFMQSAPFQHVREEFQPC